MSLAFPEPGPVTGNNNKDTDNFMTQYFYWLVDFFLLSHEFNRIYTLLNTGLSLATYLVGIVKIDSVPVLQVGCHARSELELRGGGRD